MYKRTTRSWLKHIDFIILDLIALFVSFTAAYYIRLGGYRLFNDAAYRNILIVILVFHVVIAFFSRNYSDIVRRGYWREFLAVIQQNLWILVCLAVYLVFTKQSATYSRLFWILFFFLNTVLMCIFRFIRKAMIRARLQNGDGQSELLVVTTTSFAEDCLQGLLKQEYQPFHVIGAAVLDAEILDSEIQGIPVVAAGQSAIMDYVMNHVVDEVLISTGEHTWVAETLAEQFLDMGIVVHMGMDKALEDLPNQQVQQLGNWHVITSSIQTASVVKLFIKRAIDIIGSIVGLIITGILFIFVAPFIYHASPGPIFFAQERVGKNGRKFKLYKFRSMYMDAEERKKDLMEQNEVQGQMFKMENDPRIIKGVGQFIRRTSIDEFPQFWNILRGDMSLVGTRPPTVDEYERYEQHHKVRLSFRPGLTGLWQVSGRSEITDFEEVVKLDEEYILNWGLLEDFRILFKTVVVVLARKGSK